MAQFAAVRHKEENVLLAAENASLKGEVEALRAFARKVAKLMNSKSREENALLQVQIINDLEESGYLPTP